MESLSQLSSDPRPMPYLAHVNKRGGAKGRRKTMYTKQIFLCHFALFVQGGGRSKGCEKGAMERESPRKTDCTGEHER